MKLKTKQIITLVAVVGSLLIVTAPAYAGQSNFFGTQEPIIAAADTCANGDKATYTSVGDNCITKDIQTVLNFLSVGVGIIIIGSIMVAGIQYMSAGDNPQNVQAAKARIRNAILALLVFALSWSFLNWLVPGGVFG